MCDSVRQKLGHTKAACDQRGPTKLVLSLGFLTPFYYFLAQYTKKAPLPNTLLLGSPILLKALQFISLGAKKSSCRLYHIKIVQQQNLPHQKSPGAESPKSKKSKSRI